MGSEKAFLQHEGKAFITLITSEMSKVSDDLIVMTGEKDEAKFERLLGGGVRIYKDTRYLSHPLGGILSGLEHARRSRAVVVGCDTPLLKAAVVDYLLHAIGSHAAAVPIWDVNDKETTEPLCSVYSVPETAKAAALAIGGDRRTVRQMVALIGDVRYVEVSELRSVDPSLASFVDVNTPSQYASLGRTGTPALVSGRVRRRRDH